MTMTYDMSQDTTTATLLPLADYANVQGVTERTVKRWLADDRVPGAVKTERGRWLIPAGAQPTADVVAIRDTQDTSQDMSPVTLDRLPSFLTIDQAATILGITPHAIRTHRDYFDIVPFGPNGSLVVPLATIRKIRGA